MPRSVHLFKNLIKNDTDRLTLISGPCLLENEKLVRKVAKALIKYTKKEKFNLVFKCRINYLRGNMRKLTLEVNGKAIEKEVDIEKLSLEELDQIWNKNKEKNSLKNK